MSSRSIGRGRCPKCGREGTIVVKVIGGREYVYPRHGKEWCYVGPLEKVDTLARVHLEDVEHARSYTLNKRVHMLKLNILKKSKSILITIALVLIVVIVIISTIYTPTSSTTNNSKLSMLEKIIAEMLREGIHFGKCNFTREKLECLLYENGTVKREVFRILRIKRLPLNGN